MSTVGGILLLILVVMLMGTLVPGTMLMLAFASDSGRQCRSRLIAVALLVVLPTLGFAGLFLHLGWNLLSS